MKIRINTPLLDWFTATSYEDGFFLYWQSEMERRRHGDDASSPRTARALRRYDGKQMQLGLGHLFLGSMPAPLGVHHAVVASGEAADMCRLSLYHSLDQYHARATRVDVQLTTIQPADWSQLRLFNRVKRAARHTAEYLESREPDGTVLATIYIGSRKSDRFARIYQKPSDDGLLLRIEGQFTNGQAEHLARQLWQRRVTEGDTIRGLLQWAGDDKLAALYLPLLDGYTPQLPRYARQDTRTDKWLLETVLPVLARRLAAHDCGETLRERFARVLQEEGR